MLQKQAKMLQSEKMFSGQQKLFFVPELSKKVVRSSQNTHFYGDKNVKQIFRTEKKTCRELFFLSLTGLKYLCIF
jgi:hypothetical protein